jgi:hypothetical protein
VPVIATASLLMALTRSGADILIAISIWLCPLRLIPVVAKSDARIDGAPRCDEANFIIIAIKKQVHFIF